MTESPGDGHIEAVPTEYAGTTFRSRLEADWAKTLNGARIKWRYEPEAITLSSGNVYIPDFWLPEIGVWLEVRGPTCRGSRRPRNSPGHGTAAASTRARVAGPAGNS